MKSIYQIVLLKEITEIVAGQSPQSKYYNNKGRGLPFYQGKKEFTEKYIGAPSKWTLKVTKKAKRDDILLSVRAPVGPVNFSCDVICIGRGLAAIRVSDRIDKDYLFYFLKKNESELESTTGAVFNSINKTQIGNIEIPLPPLPIQKQIVHILDEAFSAIDKAKANIQKNIQNAEELFQSKLDKIFSIENRNSELVEMKNICEIIAGQSPESKYYNHDRIGLPFYQGKKEFKEKFIGDPTTWTTKSTKIAFRDDILMSVRAPVGPINYSTQKICIGRGLAAIRCNQKKINKDYLFYFLLYNQNMLENNIGAVFNSINKTQIGRIEVPLVSMAEQEEIVKLLDILTENKNNLISAYDAKLDALAKLKNSLLQKAFTGELTKKVNAA